MIVARKYPPVPKGLPRYVLQFHLEAQKGAADAYYGSKVTFRILEGERKEFPELADAKNIWLLYEET